MSEPRYTTIHEDYSEISGRIKVIEEKGVRELLVDDVKQSIWSDKQKDFVGTYWSAMAMLPVEDENKELNILMCGLGGGTIIKLLRQRYQNCSLTVLELDPVIINIADKFFDVREDERTKIICCDANKWITENVASHNKKYDVIYLDAFLADKFKINYSKNHDMMQTLCSMLKDDGIFVTNQIIFSNDHTKEIEEHTIYISNYFSEIYTNIISKYSPADNIVIKAVYPVR